MEVPYGELACHCFPRPGRRRATATFPAITPIRVSDPLDRRLPARGAVASDACHGGGGETKAAAQAGRFVETSELAVAPDRRITALYPCGKMANLWRTATPVAVITAIRPRVCVRPPPAAALRCSQSAAALHRLGHQDAPPMARADIGSERGLGEARLRRRKTLHSPDDKLEIESAHPLYQSTCEPWHVYCFFSRANGVI